MIKNVRISHEEGRLARAVAAARHRSNRAAGVPERIFVKGDPILNDAEAIAAEIAVARILNVYWSPDWIAPGTQRRGPYISDLQVNGEGIDVKRIRSGSPHIYIYKKQSTVPFFVIVSGTIPEFRILGYTRSGPARSPSYWIPASQSKNQRGVYKVPTDILEPWESFLFDAYSLKG